MTAASSASSFSVDAVDVTFFVVIEKIDSSSGMAKQILEEIQEAQLVIANSNLDDEAKQGVDATLTRLLGAFSIGGLNNQAASMIGDVPGAVANFVILLSASGIDTKVEVPAEANNLAARIEKLLGEFDNDALDPIVRDLAKQHLQILATMLRHLPIFGLEAAMSTYFELVLKVRRADAATTSDQKTAVKPLMEKIDAFQEDLGKLDKLWNVGARWIGRAKTAAILSGLLPHA